MNPDTEPAAPSLSGKKPYISFLFATWFGLGYLPKAPGTWGSLGGVALSIALHWIFANSSLTSWRLVWRNNVWHAESQANFAGILITISIAILGVVAATRASRHAAKKDPQWIVIDEVSGQLITYYLFFWLVPLDWKTWLLGFILFRLFDIWKPPPARQLELLPGGWGIMADDWMAGIYAAIVLLIAAHFRVL
jgi:phosphatidylglycerophosphatase A